LLPPQKYVRGGDSDLDSTAQPNGWKPEAHRLFQLLYKELREVAARHMHREPAAGTFSPTVLVSEVYLKLMNQDSDCKWRSRSHFVALASRAMRQVLIDAARRRKAARRAGVMVDLDSEEIPVRPTLDVDQVIALDRALERLSSDNPRGPRQVQLIEMVWFGGLTIAEAAEELGVDRSTANRDSNYAKAWLAHHLTHE
jgi:RNA polymerase sigma factor (TIGR02999 family)